MAYCPRKEEYGYEGSRFEKDVDQHFHCSICYNVLKEPRMCRNNEHIFCLACITQHLKVNSQTCPECNEDLSVDTLRRAPRVLNNYLSNLKINCDYASRGCREFTCVEDLKIHVAICGFAPLLCSNENCGMVINNKERLHHETVVCKYRKVKCHDCEQIQETVRRLAGNFMELDGKVGTANIETKKNHLELIKIVGKLEQSLVGMNKKMNESVEALRKQIMNNQEEFQQEVKKDFGEIKKKVGEVEEKVRKVTEVIGEVKKEAEEMKKEVGQVKEAVREVKKEVGQVKVAVEEIKKEGRAVTEEVQVMKVEDIVKVPNQLPYPTSSMSCAPKDHILISGGDETGKSTEIYSWEYNGWLEVSPMNEEHSGASSFIYNDQLFVVGGECNDTIETMDLNELPLRWMKFPGNLPSSCDDHQNVVYQWRVVHIGGFNYESERRSDVISELQLTSPCTMKELCKMPKPRGCHGAEIFEEKILIFGGDDSDDALDSVLEFDPKKNECKEMPPLPHPLTQMATVQWRDQAVVLGGRDKDGLVLNDVFMYDCKTGKATSLPSMLERRYQCCAVITGNTIVVMGGENNDKYLNSAECLTMGRSTWEFLPSMNKARWSAVAEVLPPTRKYV